MTGYLEFKYKGAIKEEKKELEEEESKKENLEEDDADDFGCDDEIADENRI